ncbi:MAG TPA: YraN family protein [Steroidobacteraceae bacterium]|nr:YraN family protein [Steroidobacteraceae bacterium]
MSQAAHLEIGRAAEIAAARMLERSGYRILQNNFRTKGGELDVVALDGEALAIVEVRYRASDQYGGGAASITVGKRRRIVSAARALLATQPLLARLPARFDVVEVTGPADALACHLIRGAFSL